jgi:hypothetical protein
MHHGYTLEWIASDLGVTKPALKKWIHQGLFEGTTWCRHGAYPHGRYGPDFLARARAIDRVRQLWPRGPMENWRDRILNHDGDDDEA